MVVRNCKFQSTVVGNKLVLSGFSTYVCKCTIGYTGERCTKWVHGKVSSCETNPCPEGTTWYDNEVDYSCVNNESPKAGICDSNPCSVNETCIHEGSGYLCLNNTQTPTGFVEEGMFAGII